MENILLTGASGMVGKSILKIFKKENFIIFSPKRYNLNLSNIDKVKKYILKRKITSVIHAAGLVGGIQDNIDYPHSYLLKNSLINLSLIEAARITKIKKLIFIGSSCMYPKNINRPIEEEDLLKSPLENTNEGYAISKIFGYKLCEYSNKQHKTKFKTIVSTNLFGENDKFDGNKAHLVSAILQKVFDAKRKKEKKIEIWGDGKARRDFIHVDEVSKFILFWYFLKKEKFLLNLK